LDNSKDSLKGVLVGGLTGIAVALGGFLIAEIPGARAMGLVMFLLVPFAAGFAITIVSHGLNRVSVGTLLACFASLVVRIATGQETPPCALLALPLLFVGLMIGVALGYLFQKVGDKIRGNDVTLTAVVLLSMPLLIFTGHRIELSTLTDPRREVVTLRFGCLPSPPTFGPSFNRSIALQARNLC
jgi:uncharacterized membrane protein YoaK (UPF0700 family)